LRPPDAAVTRGSVTTCDHPPPWRRRVATAASSDSQRRRKRRRGKADRGKRRRLAGPGGSAGKLRGSRPRPPQLAALSSSLVSCHRARGQPVAASFVGERSRGPDRGLARAVSRTLVPGGPRARRPLRRASPAAAVLPFDRRDVRSQRSGPRALRPDGPHVRRRRSGALRLRRSCPVHACGYRSPGRPDGEAGRRAGHRLGDQPGHDAARPPDHRCRGEPHRPPDHRASGGLRGRRRSPDRGGGLHARTSRGHARHGPPAGGLAGRNNRSAPGHHGGVSGGDRGGRAGHAP